MSEQPQEHRPKDSSIKIPLDPEVARAMVEQQRRQNAVVEGKRRKQIIAAALLLCGAIAFCVSLGAITDNWWFTPCSLGVFALAVGFMLARE